MQHKKLLLAGLVGGGILVIGGWFLLYKSLTDTGQDLQADIGQQDQQEVPHFDAIEDPDDTGTTNNPNPEQDTPSQGLEPNPHSISVSLDEAVEKSANQLDPIVIIVPPHIEAKALQSLRKEIFKTHKVLVEFEQNRTFQAYEEAISEQHGTPTADLLLIPSNWFASYTDRGTHIPTKQPLSPLFHPAVQSLIEHPEATFIPFSLDPYVTIYDQELPLPSSITIANLQQQLLTLVAKGSHTLAMGFGISPSDIFLLEQEKQAYPEWVDILQLIIAEAAWSRNTYILEYFLQANGWNTMTAVKTARSLQEKDIACMTLTHLCLLKHQEVAMVFSRLSSLALANTLFKRSYEQNHALASMPVNKAHYPLTSWGFIVNKKSTNLPSVVAWLRGYLEHAGFGNIPLRPHTLSAFNNVFKQQEIQEPYVDILKDIEAFYLVEGEINMLQHMAKDKKLQSMLAGDYSKIIYIKEWLAKQAE